MCRQLRSMPTPMADCIVLPVDMCIKLEFTSGFNQLPALSPPMCHAQVPHKRLSCTAFGTAAAYCTTISSTPSGDTFRYFQYSSPARWCAASFAQKLINIGHMSSPSLVNYFQMFMIYQVLKVLLQQGSQEGVTRGKLQQALV